LNTITLCTFNARYTHTSIGLRYLYANLKELKQEAKIIEFVINSSIEDAVEKVLHEQPRIVGIGAYIWNAQEVSVFMDLMKKVAPDILIIVGGPEASYLPHRVDFSKADYIVQGEGDIAFYELCRALLDGHPPVKKIIKAPIVDMSQIELPYKYYNNIDVMHRYAYVEASRGCPYHCEFCLSSLDKKVRHIDSQRFLNEIEILWNRGVRNFKFIDRTFNLRIETANKLMDFFLSKEETYFVHFEVIPDHFPKSLRERIVKFPPASLQLEVGIQTLNPEISKNINRKLNIEKIRENLRFLDQETSAHLHVDLIVGLPGENLEGFGENIDRLYQMTTCEIQIGILKKLSGTTLNRHDREYGMVYSDIPPYDILKNDLIPYHEMQEMKRFARFWDLVYNSGNFNHSVIYLWEDGRVYAGFKKFSNWIYQQTESTWQISLDRLAQLLYRYLTEILEKNTLMIKNLLIHDLAVIRGRKIPKFLRIKEEGKIKENVRSTFNKRQLKHLDK